LWQLEVQRWYTAKKIPLLPDWCIITFAQNVCPSLATQEQTYVNATVLTALSMIITRWSRRSHSFMTTSPHAGFSGFEPAAEKRSILCNHLG